MHKELVPPASFSQNVPKYDLSQTHSPIHVGINYYRIFVWNSKGLTASAFSFTGTDRFTIRCDT